MDTLREVYKVIFGLINAPASTPKEVSKLNDFLKKEPWHLSLTEKHFLSTLNLKFAEVLPFLEKLDARKVIEFKGRRWATEDSGKKEKVPFYYIRFLEYVDSETIIDKENTATIANNPLFVSFDKKLCILRCGDQTYKPRMKGARCKILKSLWDSRRITDLNNEIKKEGVPKSIQELAVDGGFIEQENHFSTGTDRSVRDTIQDLRDELHKLDTSATIEVNKTIMLSVKG